MKQNKAYTLIEILLSVSLVLIFMITMVFNFGNLVNNKVQLIAKVENYITLNRYVQCKAKLSGKKTKILIETNKLKVVEEDDFSGIVTEIPTLQPQIDSLNDQTIFESEETNVITYLPDGSIEKEGTINIKVENNEEDESLWVTINEWNGIKIKSTKEVVDREEIIAR